MDGRTAGRCVPTRARAVSTGAHVWEGMVSEHHPAQVQHLAVDLAIIPGRALHDTNSALDLAREAHLAKAVVHQRLGACPRFLAWLVRLLPRFTSLPDDLVSLRRLPSPERLLTSTFS